jgi:MFS transporter, AAHS family, 4-hydroxybenzoate transporter
MTQTAGPIDVGDLIDGGRWSGYQRWLVFLTALTIIFDGIDNQLMGVTMPTIMREWSASSAASFRSLQPRS